MTAGTQKAGANFISVQNSAIPAFQRANKELRALGCRECGEALLSVAVAARLAGGGALPH